MGARSRAASHLRLVAAGLRSVGVDLRRRRSPLTNGLVVALLAVFAVQAVAGRRVGTSAAWVATSLFVEHERRAWLLSVLLHRNVQHLGANVATLWLLGRIVEPLLAATRFALLVVAAAAGSVLGGLLFTAALADGPVAVYGASGVVFGLAGFAACLLAGREDRDADDRDGPSVLGLGRPIGGRSPAEEVGVLVGLAAIGTVVADVLTGPVLTAYWINGGHAIGALTGLAAGLGWVHTGRAAAATAVDSGADSE